MLKPKLLTLTICALCHHLAYANTFQETSQQIQSQSQSWFTHLDNQIVTDFPKKDSLQAELDRQISWDKQKNTSKERQDLAEADKNQSKTHIREAFRHAGLGDLSNHLTEKEFADLVYSLEYLSDDAIYSFDPNANRMRTFDFILKDKYTRGRPYQVLDDNGNYVDNYETIKTYIDDKGKVKLNSSYPSGHTSKGFGQAVVMSLALPERGSELFSRALQYGESRVIVGAHFPTDTMTSRLSRYYYMAQLLNNDDIAQNLTHFSKQVRESLAQNCTKENLRACLDDLPQTVHDNYKKDNHNIGYYNTLKDQQTAPKLLPNQLPETSEALLRLRFPYLDNDARRQVLASTAYASNSHAQMGDVNNPNHNWGLINLPTAYEGIRHIYTDITTTDKDKTLDLAGFLEHDIWQNNITGEGGLTINHHGSLTLIGDNSFKNFNVNQGKLHLIGNNQFTNDSHINQQGILSVDGRFNSGIHVNDRGKLIIHADKNPSYIKSTHLNGQETYLVVENNAQQVHIDNLSGNGNIQPANHQLSIDNLSGNTVFLTNPSPSSIQINNVSGSHGVVSNQKLSTDTNAQNLFQVNGGDGDFYLIHNNKKTDEIEQGAYAFKLIKREDNRWQLSHLSNNNQPFASTFTKSVLGQSLALPMMMANQLQEELPQSNKSSIWAKQGYQELKIDKDNTNIKANINQTSLGFTTPIQKGNIGLYLNHQKTDIDSIRDADGKGVGLGIYAHQEIQGHQLFLHTAYQKQKLTQNNNSSHDNIQGKSYGFMVGLNRPMTLKNTLTIKPFVHVNHQKNKIDDIQSKDALMDIDFKDADMITYEMGIHLQKNHQKITPYAQASIYRQNYKQTLFINDKEHLEQSRWENNLSGTGFRGELGVTGQLTNQLSISANLGFDQQKDIDKPIKAGLMLNYNF